MSAVAFVGSKDDQNDVIITGSSTVFVNGKPIARDGDIDSHGDIKKGSGSVYVDGKLVHHIGDKDSRGNTTISGSTNVM